MADYEELPAGFRSALLERIRQSSPFWALLGLELDDIRKGWAKVRLPFDRKLVHPLGIAHGGAIFSAADSAVAMALIGMLDRSESMTTIEMKINYIRAFEEGEIVAEARIVHKGKTTAVGEVEIKDDKNRLVAAASATYLIIKKPYTEEG
jgi:acyl-CoA thioesterase